GSVLWVLGPSTRAVNNLVREARARGVGSEQLVFADHIPYAEHLSRIPHADLFLDTLPFNGGTTASDFLWMGVPVLTCAGRSFAARMAASLLHAVNLRELVTASLDDYERVARDFARNRERLAELRSRLAINRTRAPLFDTRRHCRKLEAAYGEIWSRYERGAVPAPSHLPVPR